MYSLGIDIGSSSIKTALISVKNGEVICTEQFPKTEMEIQSPKNGWAEQDPNLWWHYVKQSVLIIKESHPKQMAKVNCIGIAYQMHGLVIVDEQQNCLRPAIIWCDSRAVPIGKDAFSDLGETYCLRHLLNSPGNFTASKLKWVQEYENTTYQKVHKFMLPGDYISMKLTGTINTSISGLSEGIFWDFETNTIAEKLLNYYQISKDLVPSYNPSFFDHGTILDHLADEFGIPQNVKITYKAGDQPNNALSLNVLEPGEIAATAGTSGVVYVVSDDLFIDPSQKVNSFIHVNHSLIHRRIGILLCINGTGIANSFIKNRTQANSYEEMNQMAMKVPPGSDGLMIIPFGNGPERMLQHKNNGASIHQLQFNVHTDAHYCRAVQEGIAFSFKYGIDSLIEKGLNIKQIKAGDANLFQSTVFSQILADLLNINISLYNTDGSIGAARGAIKGLDQYADSTIFESLKVVKEYKPCPKNHETYKQFYKQWKNILETNLQINKNS